MKTQTPHTPAPASPGHTPEPWSISNSGERILGVETPEDQPVIASFYGAACDDQEGAANIRRAVACVNACAGMVNPSEEIARLRAAVAAARALHEENQERALAELDEAFGWEAGK